MHKNKVVGHQDILIDELIFSTRTLQFYNHLIYHLNQAVLLINYSSMEKLSSYI